MNIELRDYQDASVNKLRNVYRLGYKAPLLVSPTGSGKTVIFSYIAERAARRGKRVMILVHRRELVKQCSEALDNIGVEHGLIMPGRTMTASLVQVASVQTLVRRLDTAPRPDLIIIDEAHHTVAGSWSKIIEHYQKDGLHILGVTATASRLDGKGLGIPAGGFYDVLVEGPTVRNLIDTGYLSQPVMYVPPTSFDPSEFHMKFGDYNRAEISAAINKPKILGDTVDHYMRICPGSPAIAFCPSVEVAKNVAAMFNEVGINSESIDGTDSDVHRKYCINALGDGRIKVLTSCEIISEGIDIPVVRTAILLRPTSSLSLYLQQCGRVLRPYPGKKDSIILDHAGNFFRHGFVDADRDWSLEGRDPKERLTDPLMGSWRCSSCFVINPNYTKLCRGCGRLKVTDGRKIEQVEGELERIEAEEREAQEAIKEKLTRRQRQAEATTIEELEALAEDWGYHKKWATHIFRSREKKKEKARG